MPGSSISTRNSAKKIGDCSRIGRHDANGLVPCSRYSAMVSRLMASRDAGSDFPLYFFWIACISGASSCIPRDALIWRKNSGIRAMRMTITRPTMDSAHAAPPAGSRPIAERSAWNWTMIQATTTMIGLSRPSNQSIGQNSSGGQGVGEATWW